MTVEEIFNKLASHMVEGIMYHDDFAKAYDFLGLRGYARCHDYHHIEEECGYRCLSHYYATHYFKLLQLEPLTQPSIIPESWYKYSTQAVDSGTKRNAVKELMNKWVEWEKSTKQLYQEMRHELINLNEVAAALYLDKYIEDVDKELCHAQKKLLILETLGYDMNHIISQQEKIYNKYKKKLGW